MRAAMLGNYGAILTMWVGLLALASLVVRELGVSRLKRYPLTILVLTVALISLPAAGAWKLAQPYHKRLIATVVRTKSPAVLLPAGCSFFPPDNIWNTRVDGLPLDPKSSAYVESIGGAIPLHPDFGAHDGYLFNIASPGDSLRNVSFVSSPGESDAGPYRLGDHTVIEEGEDHHALVLAPGDCRLYELYGARRQGSDWEAGSGAIFDLRSNQLRPKGWTSADAAGLPLLAGLARYDEVAAGEIRHALRFTVRRTRKAFVWPARHYASRAEDPNLPPMGQRFRLRASFDVSGFDPQTQILLTALKRYGMILADNGGPWFISGTQDSRWSSRLIEDFRRVVGSDLEAVDSSGLMVAPDSGEARRP